MPIVMNLDIVMARRRMSLTTLSEKTGFSLTNLSLIKQNHAKAVRYRTLERICVALDCTPRDLLESVDDETYFKLLGRRYGEKIGRREKKNR